MAKTKGIIINMLCTNPECPYSDDKLRIKNAVTISGTGKATFDVPNSCPRCKSPLELLTFQSGSVEIVADAIDNDEE